MFTNRVKATVVLILVVLVVVPTVWAAGPINFGAKAGLALAKQSWHYTNDVKFETSLRTGLAGGVFAEHSIVPHLSVRAELMVVQKGFRKGIFYASEGTSGNEAYLHFRVNYVSMDLLLKGTLPTGTYVMAGPRLDFQMGTSKDFTDSMFDWITDSYEKTVFGLTFGLGQEYHIAPKVTLFFEGQYYLDISKEIDENSFGPDFEGTLDQIRNQSLAFYLGVRF